MSLQGCQCTICRKRRRDSDIERENSKLKNRIVELEIQVGKLESNKRLKEEVKVDHCDSCIACQLNKLKKENTRLEIEDERHHQYISKGAALAEDQRLKISKLEKEIEQFKSQTFLFCDGCGFKKKVEQLKEEIGKLIRRSDERGNYWKAVVDNCRKLMPEGSGGICLDTFIRSILKENEELKKERTEIFEHVAKWLDSKAEWFRVQIGLENFIKECQSNER